MFPVMLVGTLEVFFGRDIHAISFGLMLLRRDAGSCSNSGLSTEET